MEQDYKETDLLGFWNALLRVDLSTGESCVEPLPDKILQAGLGGKGLGSHLLLKEVPPQVDPLSAANPLIFTCGPLTATAMPGASRFGVYSKSPLTGGYAESYSGGFVAPQMKRAGFDALIIQGAAKSPVYLHISDSGVRLHSAADHWGEDTYQTEEALLAEVRQPGAQAVVIGPAGENLVRYSCLENNKWRSAGRTGLGAVMGSKKLKGIVFHGSKDCELADQGCLKRLARELTSRGNHDPGVAKYRMYGTPMMVAINNQAGSFPTRYWSAGSLDGWEQISADYLMQHFNVKPRTCHRCFMACGRLTTVREGRHAGLTIEGPEYETIFAFGGLCLIRDLAEIAYLNDLCDRLGMDTITSGNMVAFAMEAGQRGVLEAPNYGDADGAAVLLRQIAFREGIGDILAEGILTASSHLGLEDIAIHVKGMEPAGYDPRVLKGMGLAYAVASRGACHLRSTFYKFELSGAIAPDAVQEKVAMLVEVENRLAIFDSLIMCRFYRDLLQWDNLSDIIKAATNLRMDSEALSQMGNRIISLTRAFNYREGFTKEADSLPARFHDQPIGGEVISREALARMVADYYQARGWDTEGDPGDFLV